MFLTKEYSVSFVKKTAVGKYNNREYFPQALTIWNMRKTFLNNTFYFVSICTYNCFHLLIIVKIFLKCIFHCLTHCICVFIFWFWEICRHVGKHFIKTGCISQFASNASIPSRNWLFTTHVFEVLLKCPWKLVTSDVDNAISYLDAEICSELSLSSI